MLLDKVTPHNSIFYDWAFGLAVLFGQFGDIITIKSLKIANILLLCILFSGKYIETKKTLYNGVNVVCEQSMY